MEAFQLPAILRRVMKISKLEEQIQIVINPKKVKQAKLLDFMPDRYNIFDREALTKALEGEDEIKILFEMTSLESKEHINKLAIVERLQRLTELNLMAEQFEAREKDKLHG